MDAILRQHVPPEGTYLELIFDQMITPWYREIGTRGAKIYKRINCEICLLKMIKMEGEKMHQQV